ncbi:ankyrin repeat protein, partial [Ancylostoma duodenale]
MKLNEKLRPQLGVMEDGWTPLHAAAHWAEKDSCKILLEHGASITDTNYAVRGQNVLAVADKDVVEYLEDLERTVDKRKSPPAAPASILQEKNKRLSHEEHTLTTERKHEIQRKDQISENEVLLSSMKVRRLGDSKSPSPPSDSPSLRGSADSEPRSPPAVADEKMSSAERSASEPPSLQRSTNELSSGDRLSSVRSTVSAERSLPSVKPVDSQRPGSGTPSVAESAKTSDGSSSSIHSGDQHVSATVSIPTRPLQQPSSWINRGVQLITRSGSSSASSTARSSATASSDSSSPASMSLGTSSGSSGTQYSGTAAPVLPKPPCLPTTVQRSRSTPSSLPWASLSRVFNSPVQSPSDPQSPSVGTPTSPFAQSRVSAFRPLSSPSETAPPVVCGELPRGLHPHQLNPSKMRPWQSSAVTESEAERRNTARIQRQHRRSTQGVTKEHLEEASRIAMAEAARRRGSAASQSAASNTSTSSYPRETAVVRLASEERDSTSMCSDRSSASTERSGLEGSATNRLGIAPKESAEPMERGSLEHAPPATTTVSSTTPLSLPSTTAANQAVVGIRRKSQGLSVSRSNRRGTGPVLAEDIHAAVSARQTAEIGGSVTTTRTTSVDTAATTNRPSVSVSSFTRPPISSTTVRTDVTRGVETSATPNPP